MGGNSIGKEFVVTFFGESHGRCVGAVVDGCPSGLSLGEKDIQVELDRRRPGTSKVSSPRVELDEVEIISGTFEGFTTGAPICMVVWNRAAESTAYDIIRNKPRPGHADYPARIRYGGFNDFRGGGRFSGRTTASYVMAGAVAEKLLSIIGVKVVAHTIEIAGIKARMIRDAERIRKQAEENIVRCADQSAAERMEKAILKAKEEGDSVGGVVECLVEGLSAGIGEPILDSLDADFAKILFDIPAVKGVEVGLGFDAARLRGSQDNDQYALKARKVVTTSNNSGGIIGGLSNGMPLLLRAAFKPSPSIALKQKTVDLQKMKETEISISGKHDPCIVPRAVPVVESAVAITLVDHVLRAGFLPKVLGVKK